MKRLDKFREVYFAVYNEDGLTTEEVAKRVKIETAEVTPLLNELRTQGLIGGGGRGGWNFSGSRKDRVAALDTFNKKFPDFNKRRNAIEQELSTLGRSEAVGAKELRPRKSKRAKSDRSSRSSSAPVTGDVAELKVKLAAAKEAGDKKLAKQLRTALRKAGHKGGLSA